MKARTKAQRRGRKRKPDAIRTESGRISRSTESKTSEERLMLEAATWKRRQEKPMLTIEEARQPQHGSVILSWYEADQRARKRQPDQAHPHLFAKTHYDTALRLHELHERYMSAIAALRPRSSTDFGGVRGYDGVDPFSKDTARRHAAAEAEYRTARTAILEAGPFCMMAVETIVFENKDVPEFRGDLRLALNAVERLWRMTRAA